jgi:hypothetical protein
MKYKVLVSRNGLGLVDDIVKLSPERAEFYISKGLVEEVKVKREPKKVVEDGTE